MEMTKPVKNANSANMSIYSDILAGIKSQIGPEEQFKTPNQLADYLGLTPSEKTKFYNMLGDKSIPRADTFLKWAHAQGLKIVLPRGSEDNISFKSTSPLYAGEDVDNYSSKYVNNIYDYVFIQKSDATLSAGGGSLHVTGDMEESLAFKLPWIKKKTTSSIEKLKVMLVDGTSMYPTLDHGDVVLIDEGDRGEDKGPTDGKIYAIQKNENLYVKRCRKTPTGWRFMGDNRAQDYEDVDVSINDPDNFAIIGRVLWAGKEF